jgi:hypothetical protein
MQTTALSLILCVSGLLQADTLPERRGVETGEPRSRAPEVQDRLLGPLPVHQDTTGSCEQVLLALDGSPDGGFGAIWMDTRQGNLGLYLGLVGTTGEVRGTEVPLYPSSGTARQLQPDLVFTEGLSGMLCWRTGIATKLPINVRRFRGAPGFRDAPLGFGAAPDAEDIDPRAPVGRGDRGGRGSRGAEPRVAALGGGESFVAWTQAGEALAQHFDADGQPLGEVLRLDAKGSPATGSLRVASDGEGRAFVAWPTAKGVRAWIGTPTGRSLNVDAGPGKLLEAAHDPRGGWWLLLQPEKGAAVLRRLNTRGAREPEDRKLPGRLIDRAANEGFWSGLDLCVWKHGIALAAISVREKHPVRVLLFDADGRGTGREWHPLAEAGALNARVASEGPAGERLLAAWTDEREGNRDVFYSLLQPGERGAVPDPQPATRWNSDQGSSGQSQPAVASNGERALILWRDGRSGTERIWLRPVVKDSSGSGYAFDGDDQPLPVEIDWSKGEEEPSVAMLANGHVLAAWRRMGDDRLFARALDASGAARAGLTELGSVQRGAVLAAGEDSFAVLARAKDGSLFALALATDGTALGGRSTISAKNATGIDNHRLVRLDDGRWLATWDEADGKNRVLVGRLLTAELAPLGPQLGFDRSGRSGDLQPAAAPGPQNGFFMAWTAFDSRARDVAARLYDRKGKPVDRPLAISPTYSEQDAAVALRLAGGDWVVVWEDDLSGWDQIHARRARADAKTMGPAVTLNGMEQTFTMGRTGPVAVPLGDGFISAWADRSRGLGSDVFVTVVGAAFDEL